MTRAFGIPALLAFSFVVTSCGPKSVARPQAAMWDLRGSVQAVSASRLDVRHKSGRVVELKMDDRTEILATAGQRGVSAIAVGMRVAVRVETEPSGDYRARSVRVFN